MTGLSLFPEYPSNPGLSSNPVRSTSQKPEAENIALRFEQMLWTEMLSHSGLEKAFTQSGGEAASAFSRYLVEAIAEDIAEKHPLGLAQETSDDLLLSMKKD